MAEHHAVVGIYPTHTEAEAAVKALQKAGFDLQKLSIMGKAAHTEEHVVGYYNAGDRMQFWGKPCHHFLYSGGAFARLDPVNPNPTSNHAAKTKRWPRVRYKFALDIWGLMSVPYGRLSAPRM
jgi:hypothetical protein